MSNGKTGTNLNDIYYLFGERCADYYMFLFPKFQVSRVIKPSFLTTLMTFLYINPTMELKVAHRD